MEANKTELMGAYKDAEDFYKKVYTVSLDNWDLKQVFKFADNYASEVLFGKLEYANQLLLEKDKEIESYQSLIEDASKEVVKLQSELSELKEKRKEEIIKFADFIALKGYSLVQENYSKNGAMFFINKNSIGVNSSELCQQYYTQTYGQ